MSNRPCVIQTQIQASKFLAHARASLLALGEGYGVLREVWGNTRLMFEARVLCGRWLVAVDEIIAF
jgi:hypothetical protein